VFHATVVRFEAKTSESGLTARLGDGLAVGTVVGVEVAAGRIVGDGLGDAAAMDATVVGATEGTLAGDDPQPARTNATARTAVPRATITRSPLDESSPATTLIESQTWPERRTLLGPAMVRLGEDHFARDDEGVAVRGEQDE